jgi:PAS domain S-box-containing protein
MPVAAVDLFSGGGEMGERMRAFDWASTSLGPVEGWSQSLKSAVSICLTSRFPIVLMCGPDLTVLYNDAYIPILGRKHPHLALGRPGREAWGEIWNLIGPMLEGVLATGKATWSDDQLLVIDRAGFLEETYFTFSYSPFGMEAGRVEGIFTAVSITTEHVIGQRRLRTLRDLAGHVADARSPAEACVSAARTLADNPSDVPFALLYEVDRHRERADLVGFTGLEAGARAAPISVDLLEEASGWPVGEVARRGRVVVLTDVRERFGDLPGGSWEASPHSAVLLPLAQAGQGMPYGVLVVGVSPRRALDESYRGFFELVAGHVSSAVANAQAYEAAKQRAEQLAELDQAKTAFFSNVSHEFRTPLTLMLAPLEDALASATRALAGENLATVHRNGLRLLKLVNTLLDFSRIEAGRVQARFEPVDLSALTAELASAFRSLVERAGLELVVDCPPLPAPVWVDREMWEKVALNLLSNAFKFTFAGRIAVRARWLGEAVEVSVSDTGTGIQPEELPRIFERFHRVQGARGRSIEGTGIGLALVQELVKLHGGTVRAESTPGQGTTFTVRLPTGTAHLPAEALERPRTLLSTANGTGVFLREAAGWLSEGERAASGPALESASAASSGQATPLMHAAPREARVLVADDNADMLAYVERLLRGQGWEVEAVRDGQAALEAARARPPDLVLSDVMMPRLDGFGLLRALRAEPATHTVPIILLSARAGEEATVEGLEAGADDYLTKPFSARELLARVGAALAISRLRQEALRTERAQAAELEAKQALLNAVLQQMPAGVIVADPSGRPVLTNRQQEELQGGPIHPARDIAEYTGFEGLHADERRYLPHEWPLARSLTTGEVVTGEELRLRRRDGTLAVVSISSSPVRNAEGHVVAGVAITQDVTRQKEQEEELRRRVEFEQQLIGIVSHDLRNPLNAIALGAKGLLRREDLDARTAASTGRILGSAERATRMVRDLLDFTQARLGGTIPLQRQAVDLHVLARQVVEEVQAAHPGRTLRVEALGSGQGEWDADRIAQVLSNLATNAVSYSPEGTPVTVRLREEGGDVVLEVHNLGTPIPPEAMGRLFEPLQRGVQGVDSSRRSVGLGLYIVDQLVRAHGGSVAVRSLAGEGTTFTVRLPRGAGRAG